MSGLAQEGREWFARPLHPELQFQKTRTKLPAAQYPDAGEAAASCATWDDGTLGGRSERTSGLPSSGWPVQFSRSKCWEGLAVQKVDAIERSLVFPTSPHQTRFIRPKSFAGVKGPRGREARPWPQVTIEIIVWTSTLTDGDSGFERIFSVLEHG